MAAIWLVYILECGDGTLYTGVTNDMARRLAAHRRGVASRYTRTRLPVQVIHQESHTTRSDAQRREAVIKSLTREEKIRICSPDATPAPKGPKSRHRS